MRKKTLQKKKQSQRVHHLAKNKNLQKITKTLAKTTLCKKKKKKLCKKTKDEPLQKNCKTRKTKQNPLQNKKNFARNKTRPFAKKTCNKTSCKKKIIST